MRRSWPYVIAGIGGLVLIAGAFWLGSALRGGAPQASSSVAATPQDALARAAQTFALSADPQTRLAQLRIAKNVYEATTSPIVRARAINVLLGFAHSAHEPYLYDELFQGDPFQKFAVAGDEQRSLANLADFSFSLFPTAYAAQVATQVDSVKIYSLRGGTTTPEAVALIQSAAKDMRAHYATANQVIGADLEGASSPLEAEAILIGFYQWQGHILGDLSIAGQGSPDLAIKNLSLALALAQEYDAQHHTEVFDETIASVLYSRAKYAQVAGPAHDTSVRADADELAALLTAHPERYPRFFIMFKEVHDMQMGTMDSSMQSAQHMQYMEELTGRARELSLLSEPLKRLLARNGVTF